jgi:hypothetical protein
MESIAHGSNAHNNDIRSTADPPARSHEYS